uniref:Uncharacterized protein n=1 Tax=mine drainage metagenome TaxID=410659 RepID=E6PSH4_9ZZZZ
MIAHMIVSSLVHGLVYGLIFKAFRGLPLGAVALITIAGVGGIWLLSLLLSLFHRPRR